ncbi:Na+/H+ antiporter NhaD and like arsenite permease [Gottschalkia purinilytica]|uniref:Na+/H+ antiporter NhaD and like arsenite permease n=1 Tax=Gottschalkia purinilytica TaxID=1503 RepID=A0A0L0W9V4_GOTPU|nr:SLC13 family permease [Gottschalkia purinilytica]KNF08338.1 Na+/H+ antiporter NhaD and like arsenite permease [Gottschalkia purinilytica]
MIKAIIIFIITYILISGKRLNRIKIGRQAGVLLGTVLMVISRVIKPEQVYQLVNWDTILLLLGMMIIIEHLAEAEFFTLVARWVHSKNLSSKKLLALLVFGTGILAAFLVNDIVCIFFTPLLLIMIKERNLPPLPFLLGLATSTNIGGVIAFTGNPQNMIIGNLSGISYGKFFILMLPIGILGLIANYLILLRMYNKDMSIDVKNIELGEKPKAKPLLKRSLFVTFLVIIGFFIFKNIAWVAISGATLLFVISNRNETTLLKKLDWNLLLFFSGLFVVIGGLQVSGVTTAILSKTSSFLEDGFLNFFSFGILSILGSNLFANVPYVLVVAESIQKLADPTLMWFTLAFTSTIAGNLTILGAIANVIVVERARGICNISFWDFFKFGLPCTLINFIIGMLFLWGYHLIGWI